VGFSVCRWEPTEKKEKPSKEKDKKVDKIAIEPIIGCVVEDEEAWGFFVFGILVSPSCSPWSCRCLLSEQHIIYL
jgi:hypothetical protein